MKTTTLALAGILLGSLVAVPALASSEISGPTPEQVKAHSIKKAEKKAMHKKGKHFKKAAHKAKVKKAR